MDLYSEYLFVTLKKVGGQIQDLELHLKRLEKQINRYYFLADSKKILERIKNDILILDRDNCRIRVNVFAENRDTLLKENFCIDNLKFGFDVKALTKARKSINAKLVFGQNSKELEDLKIANYSGAFFLKRLALRSGFNEIIFRTNDAEILEASTSNLILKIKGEWLTPKRFIYKGITRQKFIDSGKVKESIIYLANISQCSDAALINSIEGVVPVESIGDYKFNNNDLWELRDE